MDGASFECQKVVIKDPPNPPNFSVGRGKADRGAAHVKSFNIEIRGAGGADLAKYFAHDCLSFHLIYAEKYH